MRASLAALALAVLGTTASAQLAPPATAYGEAVFVISGRGWGHGVGMSQYGAYGMARAGYTYDEILGYFYTGIELGTVPAKDVRVLLAEGRRAVTIASTGPFTIRDAAGKTYRLQATPLLLRADLEITTADGPVPATPPLLVRPGKAAVLSLDGRPYRGSLEVSGQGSYLSVVNVVGLESYLQSVVAGEMPGTWPLEALRAQAVAARSYALANVLTGKPFDLYSDVRSQVYLGMAGEKGATTEAVRSTAGKVVLYGGRVASTPYFASSGGRTASAADVFGIPAPYLVSRPDPWDKTSPFHRWGPVLVGARTVQAKLDADARVIDATLVRTSSGRLRSLVLQTTSGPETIPASLVRTALELRSTWITLGVLRLDRQSGGPVVFGSPIRLSGVTRALGTPTLSSSTDGLTWSRVAQLTRDRGGAVWADVKPARTTRYRIEASSAASPALLVPVAPRLQLRQADEPGVLAGTLRPKLVGSVVVIERKEGASWTTVGEATVDGVGAFRAKVTLSPGSYRARSSATNGFVVSTSDVLEVVG